jgi:hypothetical protein
MSIKINCSPNSLPIAAFIVTKKLNKEETNVFSFSKNNETTEIEGGKVFGSFSIAYFLAEKSKDLLGKDDDEENLVNSFFI